MTYNLFNSILIDYPPQKLKRNQIIYHEGDNPSGLYFVEEGLVGLFHISESGKETFLRVFSKQSIFGHRSFFAEESYHASAIALTDTIIKHIDSKSCHEFLDKSPSIIKSILKKVALDLATAERRLAGFQDKSANKRIAESLLFLKHKYPETVWTRKEIAEYSGSTQESVARFMSYGEKEGIIKKIGRDYEILNEPALLSES